MEDQTYGSDNHRAVNRLVAAAQRGDSEAFGQLVWKYQDMAYAYGYALLEDPALAQDVAQEAFLEAYERLPGLRTPAAFTVWFRQILYKRCNRHLRRRRVTTVSIHPLIDILEETAVDPATTADHGEIHDLVCEALAALTEPQRVATTLFYLDGYSQQEISDFLEIPVTTLKKQLFTARKRMKERLFIMTGTQVQKHKPSEDRKFVDEVQFFAALGAKDVDMIRKLLKQNPDLVHIPTRWNATALRPYWPIGVTALHVAAGMGDEAMVDALLDAGADINGHRGVGQAPLASRGETPLHETAKMQNTAMAERLIARDADVNARNEGEQTSLFYAVFRHDPEMIDLLVRHGADVNMKDKEGRTAVAWAAAKGYDDIVNRLVDHGAKRPKQTAQEKPKPKKETTQSRRVPVGDLLTGRVLDRNGAPRDGRESLTDTSVHPVYPWADALSPILKTGIKIIDLMAPIPRGGNVCLFTPMSGVGLIFIETMIIKSLADIHDGRIVYLDLENGPYTIDNLILQWRADMGLGYRMLHDRMVILAGHTDDPVTQHRELVETGLAMANALQRDGHEVLLVINFKLTQIEGVTDYLKTHTAFAPEAAVTTLYVGQEPPPLRDLDAVITFDINRARSGWYPAIDVLRSHSRLLQGTRLGEGHRETVAEMRQIFTRYADLHHHVERAGTEGLFWLDNRTKDETTARRGRRLHRFLTQPLPDLEIYVRKLGAYIDLDDALAGCRAILDGACDDLPEEAFDYRGTIDEVKKAARAMG